MDRADKSEDKVLKRLLAATDRAVEPSPAEHLSDETLALFAEGALEGAEREAAVSHLAACTPCRQVAAMLLEEPREMVVLRPSRSWLTPQAVSWALAASLLIGVSAVVLVHNAGHSGPGPADVAKVQPLPVPPVQSHETPPVGRPPENALAGGPGGNFLDAAGRLTDYGYGFDGLLQREFHDPFAGQVKELEALPEGHDLQSMCNRGQRLLAWGRAKDSAQVFAEATSKFPDSAAAWLGAGLAAFVAKDPAKAVNDFQRAVELDPRNRAARINLAIALEAQGDRTAALAAWKQMLADKLSPADEGHIREQIEALERGK